ncbi:MAG: hypothetical protein JW837_18435 [Sedimentisphaerales bacterium]|nr:hypothetical protein [Sedimentisphaerales bacterium]
MDKDIESRVSSVKFLRALFSVLCFLFFFIGCSDSYKEPPLQDRVDFLTLQQKDLESRLEQVNAENEKLKQQVHTLSSLPEQVKGKNLYSLIDVEIGKYTGFFDKDKDGTKEELVVYIEPMDEQGDVIKAAAEIEVELWDLNKPDGEALIAKWPAVKPEELKKLWFIGFVKVNYRLIFDIKDKVKNFDNPLTVKVTFTDCLSGRVFKKQSVIEP